MASMVNLAEVESTFDEEGEQVCVPMKSSEHGGISSIIVALFEGLAIDIENPARAGNVAVNSGLEQVGEGWGHDA